MKLARLLFKPKWQDKNPAVRRAAIVADNDAEMLAAMPDFVRTDPDAGVRLAALKRLNEYELWRECSTADADDGLRRTARGVYIARLCANANVPPLPRRIAELDTLNSEELEKVATNALDRELRAVALSRVTRPALLIERAISDPDAQLRMTLLERIDDAGALERIAERARKTDKNLNRRARERLDALRIGSGDNATISARAKILCEKVEALMRAPDTSTEEKATAVDREWEKLGAAVPSELVNRYRGARNLTRQTRDALLAPPESVTRVEPQDSAADPGVVAALDVTESLASRTRFDAALATATAQAKRDREQRLARVAELEGHAANYEIAIDAGDTAQARRVKSDIDTVVSSIDPVPETIARRLAPLHARYAELERWMLWSHRQRREALCTEIEGLTAAGLHPDAVATRVREARDEWRRLDDTEGAAKEPAGLSGRFNALCHRALRPTKAYFDKRDEVRRGHGDELLALLARADSVTDDNIDWKALGALRHELGEAMRALDRVDPRERGGLAKRIKQHIAQLAPRISTHEKDVETSKQKLIERAASLGATDQREIPRSVRELQQQWTSLGNGRRSTDQKQWREFRAACDAAFGKLDSARKERDAQATASRAQAVEIVEQIEALAANAVDPESARSTLRDLDARWQTAGTDERALEQRYRRARDNITDQLKDSARRRRLSRYTNALQKYAALRAASSADIGSIDLDGLVPEFQKSLAARRDRLIAESPATNDDDRARDLLVRLEFLAGVESLAEDRQRRMDFQVKRLSDRMRRGDNVDVESELTTVMSAWFLLDPSTDLDTRFAAAVQAALSTLP